MANLAQDLAKAAAATAASAPYERCKGYVEEIYKSGDGSDEFDDTVGAEACAHAITPYSRPLSVC